MIAKWIRDLNDRRALSVCFRLQDSELHAMSRRLGREQMLMARHCVIRIVTSGGSVARPIDVGIVNTAWNKTDAETNKV